MAKRMLNAPLCVVVIHPGGIFGVWDEKSTPSDLKDLKRDEKGK